VPGPVFRLDLTLALSHSSSVKVGTGPFALKTIRSWERKFQLWNFRSLELSLHGTFAPTSEYRKERECAAGSERSSGGTFATSDEKTTERKFQLSHHPVVFKF